jgi:hypothetical protein
VLGVVLIIGGAAGWLGPGDFPAPVGRPLIVAFGVALLPVGAFLWLRADAPLLRTLAAANAVTAAAAITWRLAATGFSDTGTALTVATAAALALLASLQLGAAGAESASGERRRSDAAA